MAACCFVWRLVGCGVFVGVGVGGLVGFGVGMVGGVGEGLGDTISCCTFKVTILLLVGKYVALLL
jgi:hypothetical protein